MPLYLAYGLTMSLCLRNKASNELEIEKLLERATSGVSKVLLRGDAALLCAVQSCHATMLLTASGDILHRQAAPSQLRMLKIVT